MEGCEGGSKGRIYIYTLMADSYSCMAETNTTLKSNYPPSKIFKKFNYKKSFSLYFKKSNLSFNTFYESLSFPSFSYSIQFSSVQSLSRV